MMAGVLKGCRYCCYLLLGVALPSFAQEESLWADVVKLNPRLSFFVGSEYTDNARKVNSGEESELTVDTGADIGYEYTARAIDLELDYHVLHSAYRDDTFDSRTRVEGKSELVLSSLPSRYTWMVSNHQDFGLIDSRRVDTPENDSQRSTWTTGPDVNLRMSPVDTFHLDGRYIDTSYDDADSDSQRATAGVSWIRRVNPTHSVSLDTNWADVKFDGDSEESDYEQFNYGLGLKGASRLAVYSFDIGLSEIQREVGDDIDGEYLRLNLSRGWSGHTFVLALNHEITDSSIGLSLNDFDDGLSSGDKNFEGDDIVTRDRIQFDYSRRGGDERIRLSAGFSYDEEDYEEQLRDEEVYNASFGLGFAFSQNLKSEFRAGYSITNFLDEPLLGKDKDIDLSFLMTYQMSHSLNLRCRLGYEDRKNDDRELREYSAAEVSLGLSWRFQ